MILKPTDMHGYISYSWYKTRIFYGKNAYLFELVKHSKSKREHLFVEK